MKNPAEAHAEGVTAKAEGVPVERCPYTGSAHPQADEAERQKAHLRDCWFAGYYGEPLPALPKNLPAFA